MRIAASAVASQRLITGDEGSMLRSIIWRYVCLLLLVSALHASGVHVALGAPATPEPTKAIRSTLAGFELELLASGYEKPLQIVSSIDKSEPPYVVEQTGTVVSLETDKSKRITILDIKENVVLTDEAGLLGFAFHPEFPLNHLAYAHYIGKAREKENRISEFHMTAGGPVGGRNFSID